MLSPVLVFSLHLRLLLYWVSFFENESMHVGVRSFLDRVQDLYVSDAFLPLFQHGSGHIHS